MGELIFLGYYFPNLFLTRWLHRSFFVFEIAYSHFFLTNIRQTQKWKNFEKNWFKKFSARFNGFGSKNKKSTKNSNKLWYIMMVVGMAFKVFKTITLSLVFALKGQVWAWHWANSESYYVLYVYRFVRSKLTFLNRVQTEINK